ncbi:MAG: hypothetical protein KC657_16775 [Myxococcales bacterium]|nr:hypothetical protein [Myxococcales bacterium]
MRTRLTSLAVVAFAASSAAVSHGAAADEIHATRYESSERAHTVSVTVDRGFMTLVVERTVHNSGPKSDQVTFMLGLPQGAVATRLRTAGVSATGERVWFEGELMEAEAAAKKYRELTGIGGYYPKDPALLSWRQIDTLALQVFPVPAGGDKTVEYTLQIPLAYERGAYRASLPALSTEELSASVRFAAAHAEDALSVNGVAPTSAPVAASRELEIALEPRGVSKLTGAFASVAAAPNKHLVHGVVAAAPRLSETPKGAHVVVLFDASRSVRAPEAALAATRAYLSHMTDATVDFLTFDRVVREPLGRRVHVRDAIARLHAFSPTSRNGSRLDDALTKADAILSASAAPARRVLVLTDTLTREELTPAKLGAMPWRSGAVLHIAHVTDGGAPSLARDDDSPWRTLPRRTGGLFWTAATTPQVDTKARNTFEEWARPRRIDRLVVRGVTVELPSVASLAEGASIEALEVAQRATTGVAVLGELWSRPVTYAFAPTDAENKRWAGLVFGSALYDRFSEPEQMKLAMRGGVVSPVTSYLAIEPGVRPSNEGLDWSLTGTGEGGGGRGEGIGLGTIGALGRGSAFRHEAWLEQRLRAAAARCGITSGVVSIKVESTLDEIVHVRDAAGGDAKQRACVEERMWEVDLASEFVIEHAVWALSAKL